MISRLDGTVLSARGQRLVIGVGGVGLAVAVTPQTSLSAVAGRAIALHTHLVVREDDLSLYGFETEPELEAFELLIGEVVGVSIDAALVHELAGDRIVQGFAGRIGGPL